MLTALLFILINLVSYFLALRTAPYWGLVAYMNVYFNVPNVKINWWAGYLPFDRWSLLTSAVLLLSMMVHSKKLSKHKFANTKWVYVFFIVSAFVAYTFGLDSKGATGKGVSKFIYLTFTYCLIVFIILRSIVTPDQLRLFLLGVVAFVANLSLNAFLYGRRIKSRLEGIGSADANGSNEFGLLLVATIPLMFCFIASGKKHERIICLISAPLILNAFILCNSRGSAVAFVAGIFISMLVVADKKLRKGLFIAMFAAAPLFLFLADEEYINRFSTLLGASSEMDEEDAKNLSSGRTEIWAYGLEMVSDYPLGAGPGGFRKLARFYMPEEVLTFRPGAEFGVRSAHNTFMQVLVEEGILGFIVWMIMCASSFFTLRKCFKLAINLKEQDMFWKLCVFGQSTAFVSINFGGLFNSRIYYEYFWWQIAIVAVTLAILTNLTNLQESSKEESKPSLI